MSPCISSPSRNENHVLYLLLDYRNCRRSFRSYKKFDAESQETRRLYANLLYEKRVVVLRARLFPETFFPSKVKKPEQNTTWRRRDTRRKNQKRSESQSQTPQTRPTILLPPMQWDQYMVLSDSTTTAPVVSATVQDGASLPISARVPPSAPSPGELFYNSEDQSDIVFIVGGADDKAWRFPAHSFIVGKMQATQQALLKSAVEVSGSVDEGNPIDEATNTNSTRPHPVIVRITSIHPRVFEQIHRYMYTRQVSLESIESSLSLLQPAQTYRLPDITSQCLLYISNHLTPPKVLMVISNLLQPCIEEQENVANMESKCNSDCHHNDNLQNELIFQCFQMVDLHADFILQSEDFETLEHEIMVEIVKRDTLEVSTEAVVFDALMRWACRACKQQRRELTAENKCLVLGKALFLVRYLVMTQEEFLRGPISQGMLSKEDKDAMLSRITKKPDAHLIPLPNRWTDWKISTKRKNHCALAVTSPCSDRLSSSMNISITSTGTLAKSSVERKKKSMSKKLLSGVGDLVICVIHMLD